MAVLRFTDRWIQSCCAKTARDDYADQLCPGLHLRNSRRGAKTFSVMLPSMDGSSGARWAATLPFRSPRHMRKPCPCCAMPLWASIRASLSGWIPLITFSDLVDAYVTRHLKPNARTWKTIEGSLKRKELRPFRTRPAAGMARLSC